MSVEPAELDQGDGYASTDAVEQRRRIEEAAAALVDAGYSVQIVQDPSAMATSGERAVYVSPACHERITVTTRCRRVDGAWQYELSVGELVTGTVTNLVSMLDGLLPAGRRW